MPNRGPYDADDAVAVDVDSYQDARQFHGVHNLDAVCEDPSCACGGSDPDAWGFCSDSDSSGDWPILPKRTPKPPPAPSRSRRQEIKVGKTKKKRNNRPKPVTRNLKAADIVAKLDALAADNAKRNGRLLKQAMIHPLHLDNISLAELVRQKKAGKSRTWPKEPDQVYWGSDAPHMAVDKDNIPLVLHFPRYLGPRGNAFKYRLLRAFGQAMKVHVRSGRDANKRDSLEGYPYLGKKAYLSGVIQLVASWTAIGHPDDEPVPSHDVLKTGTAFRLSMNCLRELAFTGRAIDDMLSKIDPAAYEVLHKGRELLRLDGIEDDEVRRQRGEQAGKVRVSQAELDRALSRTHGFGYGVSSWKPSSQLNFDMRREIKRVRLLAGLPHLGAAFDSRMEPLSAEDTRSTLLAFMMVEKARMSASQHVYKVPELWDISLVKRRAVRAAEASQPPPRHLAVAAVQNNKLRPQIDPQLRPTQHLRRFYRVFDEAGIVVISSVPYVPRLPPNPSSRHRRCDGRFGYHDETRYPQLHVADKVYLVFCPGFGLAHSNLSDDVAWYDVDLDAHFTLERDGIYCTGDALKAVVREELDYRLRTFERTKSLAHGGPEDASERLKKYARLIAERGMMMYEARTIFAEFQRAALELRAWDNYTRALSAHKRLVRKLAVDDAEWYKPAAQTMVSEEFRGVFVKDIQWANIYGHLGVATWWAHTLSHEVLQWLESHRFEEIPDDVLALPAPELALMPAEVDDVVSRLYDAREMESDDDEPDEHEATHEPQDSKQPASNSRDVGLRLVLLARDPHPALLARDPHPALLARDLRLVLLARDPHPALLEAAQRRVLVAVDRQQHLYLRPTATAPPNDDQDMMQVDDVPLGLYTEDIHYSSPTDPSVSRDSTVPRDTAPTSAAQSTIVPHAQRVSASPLAAPVVVPLVSALPVPVPPVVTPSAVELSAVVPPAAAQPVVAPPAAAQPVPAPPVVAPPAVKLPAVELPAVELPAVELPAAAQPVPAPPAVAALGGSERVTTQSEFEATVTAPPATVLLPEFKPPAMAQPVSVAEPGGAQGAFPLGDHTPPECPDIVLGASGSGLTAPAKDESCSDKKRKLDATATADDPAPKAPRKKKAPRRRGKKKAEYYYVHVDDVDLPSWFPTTSRWSPQLFEVDKSTERMDAILEDPHAPFRYVKTSHVFRTPRPEFFGAVQDFDRAMTVWLFLRLFLLRKLETTSVTSMPGFTPPMWPKLLKLMVRDQDFEAVCSALGLDVVSQQMLSAASAMQGVEDATIWGSDLEHQALDANVFAIPASFFDQLAELDRAASSDMQPGNSPPSNEAQSADEQHLHVEDAEISLVGMVGVAWCLDEEPSAGENACRPEDDRHLVEPPDWHTRDAEGFEHWYEIDCGTMCRLEPSGKLFRDVVSQLECWFDYDRGRKLYFSRTLRTRSRKDQIRRGEHLLGYGSGVGSIFAWTGPSESAVEPSRRIWPATFRPARELRRVAPPPPSESPARVPPITDRFLWAPENPRALYTKKILELAPSTISVDGHQLAPFSDPDWLPEKLRIYLVWELYEMQFRNALYMVDFAIHKAHPDLLSTVADGNADDAAVRSRRREAQLRACWGGGNMKPDDSSPSPFSVAETTAATLEALVALFKFMSCWPRSEQYLKNPDSEWTLDNIDELARMVWPFFSQSHFDYLRVFPPIPRLRPPLPW
ncbi:hypothetical protein AURDEDRAFT_171005 [Auricularia subglabra TFB-10046 SS5]|nr:hypothetical protein AURDEDRAFT_171005 [Auricularia subglabra TFB-10046 SS5]